MSKKYGMEWYGFKIIDNQSIIFMYFFGHTYTYPIHPH